MPTTPSSPQEPAATPRSERREFWTGVKVAGPMVPGSAIFGLAFGALVSEYGYPWWAAVLASGTMFAGAAQISIVEQLHLGAPAAIAVLTGLVINARLALYSAALAPRWAPDPLRWRLWLAHLMTDQAAVIALTEADRFADAGRRRWFTLGAAVSLVVPWVITTGAGAILGPVIPAAWQLGFVVPLMFVSILVPVLRDRPAVVAVLVAAVVVAVAKDLPYGLNIVVGALAGIGAGAALPQPDHQVDEVAR